MPGFVTVTGPHPAPGTLGFCLVCAGAAKHQGLLKAQPEIQAHESSGEGELTVQLDLPGFPALAVAWSRIMTIGVAAPVCWTHTEPIDLRTGGFIQPASAAERAALNSQHGAVHLDRPH
jgi:hypothetical protein